MALTPYPSLATLPEILANAGKVPSSFLSGSGSGGGSGRTIYASEVSGVVLDCDIFTGLTATGGAPTDNAAAINAILATATANNPVYLVIDGGCAIGYPGLLIPSTGHVSISGHGWDTGLYVLPGSNCNPISNIAGTNLAISHEWAPGVGATANRGRNVTLSNFRIHCNRGTYPDGNCNGQVDGTNGAAVSPDARGPQTATWLLTGPMFVGIDNLVLERLWVYDAPTFHVDLYACTRVRVYQCRIEAAHPEISGNTDGVHCNGGCSDVQIAYTGFATGDDCVAFNLDEGNGQDGADLVMSHCVCVGCQTVLRVYGKSSGAARRVEMSHVKATGIRYWAITLGDDGGVSASLAEATHSLSATDCDFTFGSAQGYDNSILSIAGNAGSVELTRCRFHEPTQAYPFVTMTPLVSTVSRLSIVDCSIYRNQFGNAAAYLLSGNYGTIGDLVVENFHVAEQSGQAYTDIPSLISLTGTTVGSLTFSGKLKGVGTILAIGTGSTVGAIDLPDVTHQSNAGSPSSYSIATGGTTPIPVSVGRYRGVNLGGIGGNRLVFSGPGLISSGFSFPDANVGDGSLFHGSDHSGSLGVKVSGTFKTVVLS